METKTYPIASTVIQLNSDTFQLDVLVNNEVKLVINKDSGYVDISAEGDNFILNFDGTAKEYDTEMLYSNLRSFKVSSSPFEDCQAGGIGVIDIRDLRVTYNWCISDCAISLILTQVVVQGSADPKDALIVYRGQESSPCFTETQE